MLDYCFSKDYVTMEEDGSIERLPGCPEWLHFKESKGGNIYFYAKIGKTQVFVDSPEFFEYLKNQIETNESRTTDKIHETSLSVTGREGGS